MSRGFPKHLRGAEEGEKYEERREDMEENGTQARTKILLAGSNGKKRGLSSWKGNQKRIAGRAAGGQRRNWGGTALKEKWCK